MLLLLHAAASVDDHDVLLLSGLLNCAPCLRTDGVSDDSGVNCVLGEKWLEIGDVVNDVRLEARRQHVLRLFIGTEAAGRVDRRATLLAAKTGIDTAAAPPGRLHANKAVGLDAIELLRLLFDDVLVRGWGNARHVERPSSTAVTVFYRHIVNSTFTWHVHLSMMLLWLCF